MPPLLRPGSMLDVNTEQTTVRCLWEIKQQSVIHPKLFWRNTTQLLPTNCFSKFLVYYAAARRKEEISVAFVRPSVCRVHSE